MAPGRVGEMNRPRRLILLRHGEPAIGAGRLLGSRLDPGLSERGRAQAIEGGRALMGRSIGRIVCSPLRRARETAAAAFPGFPIIVDPRLEEQDFGDLSGLTWEEAKVHYGDRARAWRLAGGPPPGGETSARLRVRVLDAAADAARQDSLGEIVLVTHHTPIRVLVCEARGWPDGDWRRIDVPFGGRRLVRFAASARPAR